MSLPVIRTVTTGISIDIHSSNGDFAEHVAIKLRLASLFNDAAKAKYISNGYMVQTTRVVTNPFHEWLDITSLDRALQGIRVLVDICKGNGISFLNIGPGIGHEAITMIPDLLLCSGVINCSSFIPLNEYGVPDEDICNLTATIIDRMSKESDNGMGNFRFCASANMIPHIPFFPAGYHAGSNTSFAIGLESSKIAVEAFRGVNTMIEAETALRLKFNAYLTPIESIAQQLATEYGYGYNGIDSSLNPSLDAKESLVLAFESCPWVTIFGKGGTLATAAMCTKVLKSLEVKTCGYSGLMLPPLEDPLLAQRLEEGIYGINDLLLLSSVCGIGLDCVPVTGQYKLEHISSVLMDVASLAYRLKKPLSCRLFPVPDLKAGERTTFTSPYLCNTKVLSFN